MKADYPNLFTEGRIARFTTRNRYVMSPAETLYASANGEVTPQIIEFYRRRAKGGVGMIILHSVQGNSHVDPLDPYAGSLRLDNNAYIPMMSDLVEAVHNEGSKIACLVSIGGGAMGAGEEYVDGAAKDKRRVAPSNVYNQDGSLKARALTVEEIHEMVEEYGKCAWRAKAAGFDAYFIHALGSYLLAEFLSPIHNHRTDEYGGSAENRWRLVFELIDSCQRHAGKDFPLVLRISVDEFHPKARGLEETLEYLKKVEAAGVAALDVTAGCMDAEHRSLPPLYVKPGVNKDFVKAVRRTVSIPLIHSGHMKDPKLAEEYLSEGVCDFVSVARGLICDPDLPNKVMAGREETIRKCLSCNYCIGHRIMNRLPIRCGFNPYAGHETTDCEEVAKAPVTKHYTVVGAGPAGLELTYMLLKKGHCVNLYEEGPAFCSSQITAAAVPPCKEPLKNIAEFYTNVLKDFKGLEVHFNTRFTNALANTVYSDCIFVATGAKPLVPGIPGIDGKNVVLAQDVLLGSACTGKKVLVLGGGQIGSETAHYLAETKGCEVTVVDLLPAIAMQEEPLTRSALMSVLSKAGVKAIVNSKVETIGEKSAVVCNVVTGEKTTMEFDTAVVAFGTRSENSLAKELEAAGYNVRTIGDALKVGNVATAIANAHYVANAY